jgi:hypothetical protein
LKGQLGTDITFLFAYVGFILFVGYVGGLANMPVVKNVPGAPPTAVQAPNLLDVFAPFGYFLSMLTVSTDYQMLFILLIAPAIVVIIYILIKALPFT